jgi:hypothetical protein
METGNNKTGKEVLHNVGCHYGTAIKATEERILIPLTSV